MAKQKKSRRKPCALEKQGNVAVPIYRSVHQKNGRTYETFTVKFYGPDHKIERKNFADLAQATKKAREVAEAVAKGQADAHRTNDQFKADACRAYCILSEVGFRDLVLPAQLLAEALKLVGKDQLLLACQSWAERNPGGVFNPKPLVEAVDEFLAGHKPQISLRRHRTNSSYLNTLKEMFPDSKVHEITSTALTDEVNAKAWAKKTRNDFLGTVSLFFEEALRRNWAAINPASAKAIKRAKLKAGSVQIFTVEEGRKLMRSLGGDLAPFLALWMFSGCRKEEVARLTWDQVGQGIEAGSFYLRDDQAKTGQARAVPVCDNLRSWLMAYRKATGPILPPEWRAEDALQQMQKLDDLQKYIARQTKISWKGNGPRHSYATYHLALNNDATSLVRAMGTSLTKLERHYWARAECVTKEMAAEWFAICPEPIPEVIQMPQPAN